MPTCPECGAEMRQTRRGATLAKRGPSYVCPVAEAELVKDEQGHLHRPADAKHEYVRAWQEHELREIALPAPAPVKRGGIGWK